MEWFIFDCILAILGFLGLAAIMLAIIIIVYLTRNGDVPDDERHREEDEEQLEWIRKWREKNEGN